MSSQRLQQVVCYVSAKLKQRLTEQRKQLPTRTSESSYVEGILRKHFARKGGKRANERRRA